MGPIQKKSTPRMKGLAKSKPSKRSRRRAGDMRGRGRVSAVVTVAIDTSSYCLPPKRRSFIIKPGRVCSAAVHACTYNLCPLFESSVIYVDGFLPDELHQRKFQ